jgi:hypothetical protein
MATKNASKMPITFEVFKKACADRGYTSRISDYSARDISPTNVFVMFTKNNIKTEIKLKNYTIGYGRTNEELDVLEEVMRERGFPIKSRNALLNIDFEKGVDVLERFWEIVALEENIEGIVAATRGTATKVFTKSVAEEAIFEKIAKRYFYAIENEDQLMLDMARTLLSGDEIDHLITRGSSAAQTEEDTYREHIVPCIMIHNKAIEMAMAGNSIVEVAQMVASNLGIILISNKEQQILDVDKGWRTTMPTGWKFGDDPLARLSQAAIQLK